MKQKEKITLTKEENKIYREQKVFYICKKRFSTDDDNEQYFKVKYHYNFTEK